ncbi:hypothetical protein AgCh_027044 [Apium graveolens]
MSDTRTRVRAGRVNLTHLKVYAIDVDEDDELDDAPSATRLQDGPIKVWIHVADPIVLFNQVAFWTGSMICREAFKRGTSVFLPTSTYPMFPEKLAMEGMSMKQIRGNCIAEYQVENSVIKPTYMLMYESASELLHLNLEKEAEVRILSEAASLRLQWHREQKVTSLNDHVESAAIPRGKKTDLKDKIFELQLKGFNGGSRDTCVSKVEILGRRSSMYIGRVSLLYITSAPSLGGEKVGKRSAFSWSFKRYDSNISVAEHNKARKGDVEEAELLKAIKML